MTVQHDVLSEDLLFRTDHKPIFCEDRLKLHERMKSLWICRLLVDSYLDEILWLVFCKPEKLSRIKKKKSEVLQIARCFWFFQAIIRKNMSTSVYSGYATFGRQQLRSNDYSITSQWWESESVKKSYEITCCKLVNLSATWYVEYVWELIEWIKSQSGITNRRNKNSEIGNYFFDFRHGSSITDVQYIVEGCMSSHFIARRSHTRNITMYWNKLTLITTNLQKNELTLVNKSSSHFTSWWTNSWTSWTVKMINVSDNTTPITMRRVLSREEPYKLQRNKFFLS